jgi:hypothetical protein
VGGGHGEAAGLRRAAPHLIGSFGTPEEVAEAIICWVAWYSLPRGTGELWVAENESCPAVCCRNCFAPAGNGETPHPSYTTTLIDHVPVSDLCDEHQLSPTLFYAWQKQFFENGPNAFERENAAPQSQHLRTISALRDALSVQLRDR